MTPIRIQAISCFIQLHNTCLWYFVLVFGLETLDTSSSLDVILLHICIVLGSGGPYRRAHQKTLPLPFFLSGGWQEKPEERHSDT